MRDLMAARETALATAQATQAGGDAAATCAALENVMALGEAEAAAMPRYVAAHGRQDPSLADRQAQRDALHSAQVRDAGVWYRTCSDKAEPANYDDWAAADSGLKAELTVFTATATPATDAMDDPARYDQVCAPLRRSMAMLAVAQSRLIRMTKLAEGDAGRAETTRGYVTAVETTRDALADDAAACVDGFYARPLFAKNIYAGSQDVKQNYVLIPTFLETVLEGLERERQAMHAKVLDAKADFDRVYDAGYNTGMCAAKAYGADVVGQEMKIYGRMQDASQAYPALADYYRKASDSLYQTYSVFNTMCY